MDPINLERYHFWDNEKTNIASVYFDMSGITGLIGKYGEHDGVLTFKSTYRYRFLMIFYGATTMGEMTPLNHIWWLPVVGHQAEGINSRM